MSEGDEIILMSEYMNRNLSIFIENLKNEKTISRELITDTVKQLKEIVDGLKEFLKNSKNQNCEHQVEILLLLVRFILLIKSLN